MEDSFMFSSITSHNNRDGATEKCIAPNTLDRSGTLSTSAAHSNSGSLELRMNNGSKVWPYDSSFDDQNNENYKGSRGENIISDSNTSFVANWETDALLWLPPEPNDEEDDMEDSIANNDDDDDDDEYDSYGDGIKWGQPSSLSTLGGEHRIGTNYKEEHKKAMLEAMNGQFKFLASRFLASEGIISSKEESDNGWLNIVASLSWEAALMIKPDANEGRAMDPASYVKVKCIAHGTRNQSEVIKGLVFKKNTAHKHMPTKITNPRLLLLKGVLGELGVGLSSFNTMIQDKDNLKSLIEAIESCHPNVILVEKTASRDVQEMLSAKKITLVFDMKLERLEKIARCTASQIFSSDNIPMFTKLRQCDYFHTERFVGEHNQSTEGGKKMSKTLMFFEGCPKPLGCTILLKGAHSDELKKVKRVMHYTVFAAYHLILETSFFADQKAITCDPVDIDGQNSLINQVASSTSSDTATNLNLNGSSPDTLDLEYTVNDVPISDVNSQKSDPEQDKSKSDLAYEGYCAQNATNVSISAMSYKGPVVHDSHGPVLQEKPSGLCLPLLPGQMVSSASSEFTKFVAEADNLDYGSFDYMTRYFFFPENNDVNKHNCMDSYSKETPNIETDVASGLKEGKTQDELSADVKIPGSDLNASLEHVVDGNNKDNIPQKGDIDAVLDPQSILVLFSSRSIFKDTICEQSHLIRIKYYGNFDISLGHFLQNILLSQRSCVGCGAWPESHIYSYTHQNGKLTVQVRRLLSQSPHLGGAAQGKIWMWTRCLKCHHESGIPRSTKRVVMSTAARSLSFGKFLELSFSSHSAARRLSRCGHLLHRDCLRFFGLGSKVAMFKYSPVEIFTACKPPPLLEFNSPVGQEWFEMEANDVRKTGETLFSNINYLLEEISPKFSEQPMNLPGSSISFFEVQEMLKQEKINFEKMTGCLVFSGPSIYPLFNLTYLYREMLLELYVWDSRLQSILSTINNDAIAKESPVDMIYSTGMDNDNGFQVDEKGPDGSGTGTMIEIEESSFGQNDVSSANTCQVDSPELLAERSGAVKLVEETVDENLENIVDRASASGQVRHEDATFPPDALSVSFNDKSLSSFEMQAGKDATLHSGHVKGCNSSMDFESGIDHGCLNVEVLPRYTDSGKHLDSCASEESVNILVEGPQDWIWNPFQEIRKEFWKDHSSGYSEHFKFIFSYSPQYLEALHQLNSREGQRLCYPVDDVVICLHEEEVSSIIACALVLYQEHFTSLDDMAGKDRADVDHEIEDIRKLAVDGGVFSSSSTGSINLERIQSMQNLPSILSDEVSTSGNDGSLFVDRLLSSENLHPEIQLGLDRISGRSKYSVVCIYAKQFFALRRHCCPSEIAYLSSLNRCMKWDAKGGKSKALFAKTLDDRFIIKEIKKAELASFLKFAPEYFKHVSESLRSGSQTCLAKILGIYQVTQNKGGREIKMDLMVMENLLFGRNISRTYDLKGALFSRYISDPDDSGAVLLDQNFVEDMGLSPTYVGGRTKHLLQRAIWNDTSFLTSINVMDYSLLVGVHKERHQLVFGIIDYLRQYTWDKQLESWVKLSLVVPKNASPTVVSPKEYKKRFRKFMSKYFLTVPDSWTTDRTSDSCRSCTDGNVDFSQVRNADFQDRSTDVSAEV